MNGRAVENSTILRIKSGKPSAVALYLAAISLGALAPVSNYPRCNYCPVQTGLGLPICYSKYRYMA
jgi:hypothetical protein